MPLGKEEQERLARICVFLETELEDLRGLGNPQAVYRTTAASRNLDRCIENIVNASFMEILLASENLPRTRNTSFNSRPGVSGSRRGPRPMGAA
jgi:hypothetical protein